MVCRPEGRKPALGTLGSMGCRIGSTSAGASISCRMPSTDGRPFRGRAVVDAFSRECLALVADTSLSGLRVTRELDALMPSEQAIGHRLGQRRRTALDGGSQGVMSPLPRAEVQIAAYRLGRRFELAVW